MNGAGKTGYPRSKERIWILTLHHKQKLTQKWIKDLNASIKIVKDLEENTGEKLCGIGCGNGFFGMTPTAQATKEQK